MGTCRAGRPGDCCGSHSTWPTSAATCLTSATSTMCWVGQPAISLESLGAAADCPDTDRYCWRSLRRRPAGAHHMGSVPDQHDRGAGRGTVEHGSAVACIGGLRSRPGRSAARGGTRCQSRAQRRPLTAPARRGQQRRNGSVFVAYGAGRHRGTGRLSDRVGAPTADGLGRLVACSPRLGCGDFRCGRWLVDVLVVAAGSAGRAAANAHGATSGQVGFATLVAGALISAAATLKFTIDGFAPDGRCCSPLFVRRRRGLGRAHTPRGIAGDRTARVNFTVDACRGAIDGRRADSRAARPGGQRAATRDPLSTDAGRPEEVDDPIAVTGVASTSASRLGRPEAGRDPAPGGGVFDPPRMRRPRRPHHRRPRACTPASSCVDARRPSATELQAQGRLRLLQGRRRRLQAEEFSRRQRHLQHLTGASGRYHRRQ